MSASTNHQYFNIIELKRAYERGENITALMRARLGVDHNTSEIIETAYDLQAGSYIEYAQNNAEGVSRYAAEIAGILDNHVKADSTLVDLGTGEMTTLCPVLSNMETELSDVYAFDISWSRIHKGKAYVETNFSQLTNKLYPFVADMTLVPIRDKAIDYVTSSHALEPNGGRLNNLLTELFRITREKLILFEPSYELGTDQARARMDSLGYIKGMEEEITALGGELEANFLLENIARETNPTACFVIKPPQTAPQEETSSASVFSVPGTDHALEQDSAFYYSPETGLGFPIIEDIPVLKPNSSILMTGYQK